MTQLPTEGGNLYLNDGSGLFEDRSSSSGLGPLTRGYTGFGTAWFDFDNDGWLDLFAANGSIEAQPARINEKFPYDERMLLFRNLRDGRFENVSAQSGAAFGVSVVGRGAAFGDIDNDGDVDLVISNMHHQASLLINNVGNRHHWIGLRLIGCPSASSPCRKERDMLGARIQVVRQSGPALWRRARADGSYASANDPRVLAGLGDSATITKVHVQWPDGTADEWTGVPVDRYTTLREGEGR